MIPDYKRNIVANLSAKIILPHKRMLCLSCQVGMPVWLCQKMWPRICRFNEWNHVRIWPFGYSKLPSFPVARVPCLRLWSCCRIEEISQSSLTSWYQIIKIKNWQDSSPEYILGVVICFNIVISEADGDSIKMTPENRYVWDWHVYICGHYPKVLQGINNNTNNNNQTN